jgi:Transposase IS66 family
MGLQLPRCGTAAAALGSPRARPHRPQRGPRRPEGVRRGRPRDRRTAVRRLEPVPLDADRARLSERIGLLKQELRAMLEQAARKSARNRTFASNLLRRWPVLWTFASATGVEPTNNHAERGLRGAVIHRKLSLGSQSARGSAPSSGCCRPRPLAAYRGARCSPTSATSLPPGSAAPPSPARLIQQGA